MYKQADKKRYEASRATGGGGSVQTNITNFFVKKPSPQKSVTQPLPGRDFTLTYGKATKNSSALRPPNLPSPPKSGYQPYMLNYNPTSSSHNGNNSFSNSVPNHFGLNKPRVFNSHFTTSNVSTKQNSVSSLVGNLSTANVYKKGMSKPVPRGGPLTGNGSGVYVVSKRPKDPLTISQGPKSFQASSSQPTVRKRMAPWGPKEPESIRFSKPPPPTQNPFRKQPTSSVLNKAKISRSQLSPCQLKVVDAIFNRGANVFFTGPAGTGKSFLLQYIISELRDEQDSFGNHRAKSFGFASGGGEGLLSDTLAITASTGIAAFQLGGTTIHSFAGIGLGHGSVASLVAKVNKNRKALARWLGLKYLIIDEVSMLDGDLFATLDSLARTLRRNPKPFGGIQLILAGDFFQLPPVNRDGPTKFCFESPSWGECVTETFILEQIFRQHDPEFSAILNEARIGVLSAKAIEVFKSLSRQVRYPDDGIQATEIFSTRKEVDESNYRRLATLPGELVRIEARDSGTDPYAVNNLDNYTMYPKLLELKLHAQVMLVKNQTQKHPALVNGSLGIVTGFMEANSEELGDEAKGWGLGGSATPNHTAQSGGTQLYPRVRFTSGVELLILPEESTFERNNVVVATRYQVPLVLAWALSIHKAQGQTLDRLKVDLSKVFEKGTGLLASLTNLLLGQAYVALSRATSLNSLQVVAFDPSKVVAHPKVAEFYRACIAKP